MYIYNIIYDIKSPANFSWITQTFQVLSGGFVMGKPRDHPDIFGSQETERGRG